MKGQILPINKPRGKSSFWVIKQIKKIYPHLKVGHAGTLDPLAEGLLLVLIGQATKQQSQLMNLPKEYIVYCRFGVISESMDLECPLKPYLKDSQKLQQKLAWLTKDKIKKVISSWRGRIQQKVPLYSAVKVKGKRLCDLTRAGCQVEPPTKTVYLYQSKLLKFWPVDEKRPWPEAKIWLKVGKGFYVRSFVAELGEKLGVGAVVIRLIRTKIGSWELSQAIPGENILANEDRLRLLTQDRPVSQ